MVAEELRSPDVEGAHVFVADRDAVRSVGRTRIAVDRETDFGCVGADQADDGGDAAQWLTLPVPASAEAIIPVISG